MSETVRLAAAPGLGRLYARALATARGRHGDRLPATVYELDEVGIDPERLAAYDEVCGFRLSDTLPSTYPHVLAFPVAMALMADRDFPFALPGLVHVANRIVQRRPVRLEERLGFRVQARDLRPHRSGQQFDVVVEAIAGGERVWTGTSTYLRRGAGSGGGGAGRDDQRPPAPRATATWRVAGDTGRRYAGVSGDSNPIHLHPLTARLFGFPRAIAHGMWVKARCLAALEGRLPDALDVQVDFRAPLLLPSTVLFSAHPSRAEWRFEVRSRSGRPHLEGSATEAAAAG